jgi:hypothetical protein
VTTDLRGDWMSALGAAGFDRGSRSAWLVEGLLFYLTRDEGARLLSSVPRVAGSRLILEQVNGAMFELLEPVRAALAGGGAPWRSSIDDPGRWLRGLGWDARVFDQTDAGVRFGRPLPRHALADGRAAASMAHRGARTSGSDPIIDRGGWTLVELALDGIPETTLWTLHDDDERLASDALRRRGAPVDDRAPGRDRTQGE